MKLKKLYKDGGNLSKKSLVDTMFPQKSNRNVAESTAHIIDSIRQDQATTPAAPAKPVSLNERVTRQNAAMGTQKKNYAIVDKKSDSIFYFNPKGQNITGEPVITGKSGNDVDHGMSMKEYFTKTKTDNHEDYFKYLEANKAQTTPAGSFTINNMRTNTATSPDKLGNLINIFRPERAHKIATDRMRDYGRQEKMFTLTGDDGKASSKAIHGTLNPVREDAFDKGDVSRKLSNGCINVNGTSKCFDELQTGSKVVIMPEESDNIITPSNAKKVYANGGELKPGALPSGASIGNKDYDTIPSYLYYIKARQENNQEGMNRSLAHVTETRGPQVATRLQFLGKSMGNSNINDIAKRSIGGETDPQMRLLYSHINENPDAVSKFDMYMPNGNKDIVTTPQPVTDGLKKVYATGGQLSSQEKMSAITGGITTGLGAIGGIADALDTPNEYGRQSTGTTVVKNAAQFAGMGATLGPVGAGVGALVGAGVGLLSANKAKRAEDLAKEQAAGAQYRATMQQGQAMVSADPNLVNGYKGAGYYRNGGDLTNLKRILSTKGKQFGHGGSLQNVSQDTELVKGPTHEQGGVQLPGNNEVEGGETIKDGFVFSKALGFAQLHKPIAKKIGLIEGKAPTAERLNSLKRLKSQEDSLALLQEQYKEQNNV